MTGYRSSVAYNDTPMVPVKGQAGPAIVVVAALLALILVFIIVSAFSQNNATTSIDGNRAVYSHNLPADAK